MIISLCSQPICAQVTTLVMERVRGNQILHYLDTQPYDGKFLLLHLSPQMQEAMNALVHRLFGKTSFDLQ